MFTQAYIFILFCNVVDGYEKITLILVVGVECKTFSFETIENLIIVMLINIIFIINTYH